MFDSSLIIDTVDLSDSFAFGADEISQVDTYNPNEVMATLEQEALNAYYQAVSDIKALRVKRVIQIATSFGKDSTLLLLAALEAHKQLVAEGKLELSAPFVVSTIDTKIENHLLRILVEEEVEKLKRYCQANNINLDFRYASPPLAKQWASLFLSGHKLPSTARLNSDCSIILKINQSERVESEIEALYGNVIIITGSRLDESSARAASLKKHGQDKRDVHDFLEKLEKGEESNVFAPISHITTEQVWMLLRRAGTDPIVKPEREGISSYADNHLLLSIIYEDSSDGTCPTTSKKVSGQGVGGCGKSSRTGCSLCLKVFKDVSGENQNKLPRHSVISGNILKVRDYLAFVSEDMSKRTWHTKAIDETTGAIAAYPNVLNAETLDELIKLLIQVTADEYLRAKQFRLKVKAGLELTDKGYADIVNDISLNERERKLFTSVYKKYAQRALHAPMNEEICLYLSLIHARDGIKLPPYRSIVLWKQLYVDFISDVEDEFAFAGGDAAALEQAHKTVVARYEQVGLRLPYPNVDVSKAPRHDAQDAVMILPYESLSEFSYVPHTGMFNADDVIGCMIDIKHDSIKVPKSVAESILPPHAELDQSQVELRGFVFDNTHSTFLNKKKPVVRKLEFSKRAIKKTSKKGGGFSVLERGRTSVGSYSFSRRNSEAVLSKRIANPVSFPKLSLEPSYIPLNESIGDSDGTYKVSFEGLCNWQDYDGYVRAIETHDKFIQNRLSRNETIYSFPGVGAFEEMQRYGLFELTKTSVTRCMMNLKRTAYFSYIGLFGLSDKNFAELASVKSESFKNLVQTEKFKGVYAKQILPMFEYRAYKAKLLLKLRSARNDKRRNLKENYKLFITKPVEHDLKQAQDYFESLLNDFNYQIQYFFERSSSSSFGASAIAGYARFLSFTLSDDKQFSKLLSQRTRKQIKTDLSALRKLEKIRCELYGRLKEIEELDRFDIQWFSMNEKKISLSAKPVVFSSNLEW